MDQIKNFKNFLHLYNQITDMCFTRCTNSFNSREIELDERNCVDICTRKFININHRVMEVYMEVQPLIVQRKMEEINNAQSALKEQS